MLNTTPSIIYFAQTDIEVVCNFTNTSSSEIIITFQDFEYGLPPNILNSFTLPLSAGDNIIAWSNNNLVSYNILVNGIDVTPSQIPLPVIRVDNLKSRKGKLESALQYLAVNVTASNISNFITTNRNTMTDYERGLDTLQTVITASVASYLTAQRKTDLLNILN